MLKLNPVHRHWLFAAGLLYLGTFVLEGILRIVLLLYHLEWALYARDLITIYGAFLLLRLDRGSNLGRAMLALFVLFAVSIFTGFCVLANPSQVLFGTKLFLPLIFGLCLGAFDTENEFLKSNTFIVLLLLAYAGVVTETFYEFPWKGLTYEVGGVQIETARVWQASGFNRVSGFSRSSYAAAIQMLVVSLILTYRLSNLYYRGLLWAVTSTCIVLTTTKSVLISVVFIFFSSWLFSNKKLSKAARYLPLWLAAVMISIPFWAHYLMEQLKVYPRYSHILFSFFDRTNHFWPLLLESIEEKGNAIYGMGMGSIGVAQYYFDASNANPGDNLFLYLYSVFGLGAVILIISVAFLASRVRDTPSERFAFLMITSTLAMGVTMNVVEDGFICVFLGYSVSLLLARQGMRKKALVVDEAVGKREGYGRAWAVS